MSIRLRSRSSDNWSLNNCNSYDRRHTKRDSWRDEREIEEGSEREGVSVTERIELAVHMQIIKHVKSRGNKLPNKLVNAWLKRCATGRILNITLYLPLCRSWQCKCAACKGQRHKYLKCNTFSSTGCVSIEIAWESWKKSLAETCRCPIEGQAR